MPGCHMSEVKRLRAAIWGTATPDTKMSIVVLASDHDAEVARLMAEIQELTHQRDITHDELVHLQNSPAFNSSGSL